MIDAPHPDQKWGNRTYAQHGDDIMLLNLFWQMGVEKPSYLDIGAHHPRNISNTKLLYERGSRGFNVDANKALIDVFCEDRPGDTNICVGVMPTEGYFPFYMHDELSGLNTFAMSEVKRLTAVDFPLSRVVRCITLNQLVDQSCGGSFPDALLIDIEGYDFDVLAGTNFSKSKPSVICIETRQADTHKMTVMMLCKGFFFYCRMGANLFFTSESL